MDLLGNVFTNSSQRSVLNYLKKQNSIQNPKYEKQSSRLILLEDTATMQQFSKYSPCFQLFCQIPYQKSHLKTPQICSKK